MGVDEVCGEFRRSNAVKYGLLLGVLTLCGAALPVQSLRADNKALGQYLASECTTCHQLSGASTSGIPAIVGWPKDQFIAVLKSYRAKERDNEVMQTISARLTDEEIAALAAYFEGEGKK